MRIIIAGGGTGGHIYPAISIADEIRRRNPDNEILFVCTKNGFGSEKILNEGYKLEYISSSGIVGKGLMDSILGTTSAIKGVFDSFRVIIKFKPNVVIGVGGYVSGPVVIATCLLFIPAVICEQNSVPGLTNRILARFSKRVFAAFDESIKYFPRVKTRVLGNPIRNQILAVNKATNIRDGLIVLVFGGSQGAHKLNISVPKAFGILGRKDINIIHQTGNHDIQDVKKRYEWYGIEAEVIPFIEDMASVYNDADLVIGRAGAGTIAEITALGKPSILVPYPFSAYNHQFENAKVLERAGAAIVIEDKDAFPERIVEALSKLLTKDKLNEMRIQAKRLGKPQAAKNIVDEIYKFTGID
ncbi:undecaprenyldiphospho-muramoylpentapeptide beta-N-acetylglucosaminyltransferase [Desulfobacterota bacterium AH_259_B03_O07]|nr:undecaprenyldiphospho-muramoylpentapeptide beta-N-acetylglucosaminyltransferase [Desulfobacterota bacterium AH_259_B03_O07]